MLDLVLKILQIGKSMCSYQRPADYIENRLIHTTYSKDIQEEHIQIQLLFQVQCSLRGTSEGKYSFSLALQLQEKITQKHSLKNRKCLSYSTSRQHNIILSAFSQKYLEHMCNENSIRGGTEKDDLVLEHRSVSKGQQNFFVSSGRHRPMLVLFPSAGF